MTTAFPFRAGCRHAHLLTGVFEVLSDLPADGQFDVSVDTHVDDHGSVFDCKSLVDLAEVVGAIDAPPSNTRMRSRLGNLSSRYRAARRGSTDCAYAGYRCYRCQEPSLRASAKQSMSRPNKVTDELLRCFAPRNDEMKERGSRHSPRPCFGRMFVAATQACRVVRLRWYVFTSLRAKRSAQMAHERARAKGRLNMGPKSSPFTSPLRPS
jgi:hypothetical protein